MAVEVGAARRRIIRRPRLTAMLDGSSSQIRMLIAPAGYGKTTLAREWLGEAERQDVWYRGGPATADVAALAAGVAEAVSGVVPDAGKRMRERIRATGHPEEDVDILAELFAEDVQDWPQDAWLAIDDYQFAMESAASERFVDLLTQLTPIQMLVTSRRAQAGPQRGESSTTRSSKSTAARSRWRTVRLARSSIDARMRSVPC
jgi:LuxR family transcriptional regulator, maltose regulon positive regulatory protein